MLKQTLNKGISTPIAIGIILILVILVGGFTWLQYGRMWRERDELPEIKIPEKEEPVLTPKQSLREWFRSIVEEDWEAVFINTVYVDFSDDEITEGDIQFYSEKCKEWFKTIFSSIAGAEYILEIEDELGNCDDFYEVGEIECLSIKNLYSVKKNNISSSNVNSLNWLVKKDGKWKVFISCPFQNEK